MSEKHHGHAHGGSHGDKHQTPKWKPHTDWRLWAVALMLIAMAVYVLTMDEALQPGGVQGERMPAAAP